MNMNTQRGVSMRMVCLCVCVCNALVTAAAAFEYNAAEKMHPALPPAICCHNIAMPKNYPIVQHTHTHTHCGPSYPPFPRQPSKRVGGRMKTPIIIIVIAINRVVIR